MASPAARTMPQVEAGTVTDLEGLRAIYRDPRPLVLRKEIDHVDEAARAFVAASPYRTTLWEPGGVG